jgi:ubiquinone/menaquinone biosynthesis C-methylase UbiE
MKLTNVEEHNKKFFSNPGQLAYYNQKSSLMPAEKNLFNKYIKKDFVVLDVGCGEGRTTKHIAQIAKNVTGIDIVPEMIAKAKEENGQVDYKVMNVCSLDFPDDYFDAVVFSYNGIDYLYPESRRMQALREINRVLKRGGLFIYSTHNFATPKNLTSLLNLIANVGTLRIFTKYWLDMHKDGYLIQYTSNRRREKSNLAKAGFSFVEDDASGHGLFKEPWTYYVFRKKENAKLKICFIAPKAYPLFNFKRFNSGRAIIRGREVLIGGGGSEVQLSLLAKEFAENNNLQIDFMVADYGQNDIECYENVRIWKSLRLLGNTPRGVFTFFAIFKKINADVYVQRALNTGTFAIAFLCKIKKRKFVYMVANDGETDGTHPLYKNLFNRFLINLMVGFTDAIIVQNAYQKRSLLMRKNKESFLLKPSWQIKQNFLKQGTYVLWVGRLDKKCKGPELFLRLANRFPSEQFVMIAPPALGQEAYFTKIKE